VLKKRFHAFEHSHGALRLPDILQRCLRFLLADLSTRSHYRNSSTTITSSHLMNTKIDIKSALIGLGIGVLVTVGIAAGSASGTVGRYQIAGTASHGLVIDTATGQVWTTYLPQGGGGADPDFAKPKAIEKK
jgi:hypothetical protein